MKAPVVVSWIGLTCLILVIAGSAEAGYHQINPMLPRVNLYAKTGDFYQILPQYPGNPDLAGYQENFVIIEKSWKTSYEAYDQSSPDLLPEPILWDIPDSQYQESHDSYDLIYETEQPAAENYYPSEVDYYYVDDYDQNNSQDNIVWQADYGSDYKTNFDFSSPADNPDPVMEWYVDPSQEVTEDHAAHQDSAEYLVDPDETLMPGEIPGSPADSPVRKKYLYWLGDGSDWKSKLDSHLVESYTALVSVSLENPDVALWRGEKYTFSTDARSCDGNPSVVYAADGLNQSFALTSHYRNRSVTNREILHHAFSPVEYQVTVPAAENRNWINANYAVFVRGITFGPLLQDYKFNNLLPELYFSGIYPWASPINWRPGGTAE